MTTIKHILRPDQEADVWKLVNEPTHAALIASEMGRGKTTIGSEFIFRMGFERVLLIGVKDTFGQWANRLAAQSDGKITLRRLDSTKQGRVNFAAFIAGEAGTYFSGSQYLTAQDWAHEGVTSLTGAKVWAFDKKTGDTIVKPSDLIGPWAVPVQKTERRHLKTYAKMAPLDAIVVDEVHVFANRDAIGLKTLKTIKSDWRVGMSGTPYGNKFIGMHTITRWLWPTLIPISMWVWISDWCVTETVYVAGGKAVENVTGEREKGAFVATLPCYIRAEAEEKAPAAEVVRVDLLPAQRRDYESLENDMLVWLDSHQGSAPLVADLPITLRSRLRTATLGVMSLNEDDEIFFAMDSASTKLNALRGVLDYWGKQPVVIYTDSKRFAKVTVARMNAAGYNTVEWSGDVSSKGRDEIKRAFLAGEVQYLVAVITAFSTGLDGFQTVCSKIVWLSQSENGTQNEQALARIFRPGRTTQYGEFQHVKILARNTLDEGIYSRKIMEVLHMNQTLSYPVAA